MTPRPTPHDFLLRLRNRHPSLARRLDGICGLAREGGTLRISVPGGSWSHREIEICWKELSAAAETFFGSPLALELQLGPKNPEALPFAVASSKVWNHVAFWAWEEREALVLAVRKSTYGESWLAGIGSEEALLDQCRSDSDVHLFRYRAPEPLPVGETAAAWLVPDVLGDLCGVARRGRSYAQLVAPFPEDKAADRLEACLYATKEWGTPAVPAPLLQKFVGRIHYACPQAPPLGLRLARQALRAGERSTSGHRGD